MLYLIPALVSLGATLGGIGILLAIYQINKPIKAKNSAEEAKNKIYINIYLAQENLDNIQAHINLLRGGKLQLTERINILKLYLEYIKKFYQDLPNGYFKEHEWDKIKYLVHRDMAELSKKPYNLNIETMQEDKDFYEELPNSIFYKGYLYKIENNEKQEKSNPQNQN